MGVSHSENINGYFEEYEFGRAEYVLGLDTVHEEWVEKGRTERLVIYIHLVQVDNI